MTLISGVDYAFEVPTIKGLLDAGVKFAVRYGGPGTSDKWLTADELQRLTNAGIDVVANAEGTSGGFRGYSNGRAWAQSALQHFKNLGMPDNRPIYFSVDFDAQSSDWADIDAACDGAASIIGRSRVGVYGSYNTVNHLHSNGKATWYWQTYAWSHGIWHSANHLEQYRNGVIIGGANLDLTRAVKSDFGQWNGLGDSMAIQDDVLAALHTYFDGVATGSDNQIEYASGQQVWKQPIPNIYRKKADGTVPRTQAWVLLTDMAADLYTETDATVLQAIATAEKNAVDDILNQLASMNVQNAATAIEAALGKEKATSLANAILALGAGS